MDVEHMVGPETCGATPPRYRGRNRMWRVAPYPSQYFTLLIHAWPRFNFHGKRHLKIVPKRAHMLGHIFHDSLHTCGNFLEYLAVAVQIHRIMYRVNDAHPPTKEVPRQQPTHDASAR